MRPIRLFIIVALNVMLMHLGDALASKRVALVIGNSNYVRVSQLPNPEKDADAFAALLRTAGFDTVELRSNLGTSDMRRALRDFADRVRGAEIAVVYYAGHGIEVDGANYLIPVDAALSRDIDVDDEAVSLDRILKILEPAKKLRLVILDACRDNPFAVIMRRTSTTRTVARGLARVEPPSSDTLVAFAARAGSTAVDGDSQHSPFTSALLKNIATPGLDLQLAFGLISGRGALVDWRSPGTICLRFSRRGYSVSRSTCTGGHAARCRRFGSGCGRVTAHRRRAASKDCR